MYSSNYWNVVLFLVSEKKPHIVDRFGRYQVTPLHIVYSAAWSTSFASRLCRRHRCQVVACFSIVRMVMPFAFQLAPYIAGVCVSMGRSNFL